MPILDLHGQNPLVDGRQSQRALTIRRGLARHFEETGQTWIAEMQLASGRRADMVCLDRKGRFTIIEIKSSVEDFRTDNKWPDYLVHCDALFFATLPDVPAEIFPPEQGLIVADDYGAEILREAPVEPLAAATRKSLLLRFAHASAGRLGRVIAHCEAQGEDLPARLLEDKED